MIAMQAILVIAGFGGAMWAMVAWMLRTTRREREIMERHWQEWAEGGSNPDEEPKFYSGSCAGGG